MHNFVKSLMVAAGALIAGAAYADDLNVALIYGRTGPLEAYAKQTETGLRLGFEYATKGTMTVDGRKINIILKDDQSKPDLAKAPSPRPMRTTMPTSPSAPPPRPRRSPCCRSPRSIKKS